MFGISYIALSGLYTAGLRPALSSYIPLGLVLKVCNLGMSDKSSRHNFGISYITLSGLYTAGLRPALSNYIPSGLFLKRHRNLGMNDKSSRQTLSPNSPNRAIYIAA